jgi:predicted O-methyltransferase YrrM
MLGALRSALSKPGGSRIQASAHPARRQSFFHRPVHDWERRLHVGLRATWPCEASLEFQSLWPSVSARVKLATMPGSRIPEHSDINPGLSRAMWCLVRHLKPRKVVEAGVGYGITSRFVLEALALNGSGQLYSVDPPMAVARRDMALAVEPRIANRWSLITDTARRALPALLSRLGSVDLFVHDTGQKGQDMRFEIDYAWLALRAGGALVLNDIGVTGSLQYFDQRYPGHHALVCEAEPAHPDPSYRDRSGLFAIVFKNPPPA